MWEQRAADDWILASALPLNPHSTTQSLDEVGGVIEITLTTYNSLPGCGLVVSIERIVLVPNTLCFLNFNQRTTLYSLTLESIPSSLFSPLFPHESEGVGGDRVYKPDPAGVSSVRTDFSP